MSKLKRIGAFIDVVEANSFAAAARKQGISTAAISRQITRLESELNTELLKRTTRNLKLTDTGANYYQLCKKIMTELANAETVILNDQTEATGLLHITGNRYFATNYLLPRLGEFMAQHPNLQIKLELAERFPDLAHEEIDLVFGVSLEGPPELVRKRVATTRYILCAAPDYLKHHGTPKTPSDLTKHHYITHTMRKPDNVIPFKNGKKITVKPLLWLNDSQAMRECAIHGMGIIRLHDYMVLETIKKGQLKEILAEFQEPPQSVYLYYQRSKYLQPKIRRFIDFYTN